VGACSGVSDLEGQINQTLELVDQNSFVGWAALLLLAGVLHSLVAQAMIVSCTTDARLI
jgi:hypothetical protein